MDKNNVYTDELEQMRHDMDALRTLLSKQKIVNERLMRRAMKRDLGKERREVMGSVALVVIAVPLYVYLQPIIGVPLWFLGITIGFLLLAGALSVWSVYRLMTEDLLTGDLLEVARRIAEYKRFGNNWLRFSIPFLCVWLGGFFYYCLQDMDSDAGRGVVVGGAIGGMIGTVCGIIYLVQSRRRLNRVLQQIEEIRNGVQ